jgi:alkylation response protein AidB-like acyl-CoA dehydrogenase
MRATGSNDVVIENAFVPEQAIGGQRPKGAWGVLHHVVMIALPLVFSVYVGVAEAARDLAVQYATKRRDDGDMQRLAGEMENQLRSAQIALRSAIDIASTAKPSPETTNEVLIRRTHLAKGAIGTVERAMEVVGGAAYFRASGIERLFRDIQGARYHPMREHEQLRRTGRAALGLGFE